MMPFIRSLEFLYKIATSEMEWGVRGEGGRGRKRGGD
jgi:hypothetical protein